MTMSEFQTLLAEVGSVRTELAALRAAVVQTSERVTAHCAAEEAVAARAPRLASYAAVVSSICAVGALFLALWR